jgi:hypothetical protein
LGKNVEQKLWPLSQMAPVCVVSSNRKIWFNVPPVSVALTS